MAETKERMPLARAETLAQHLYEHLAPGCYRLEVAGSLRRRKPDIGDIEFVAIPRFEDNLFGEPGHSSLDFYIERMLASALIECVKGGEKYKQFRVPSYHCNLDLFIVQPETWGVIFTLRTGPKEFSHRLVTPRRQGGFCPAHLRFDVGRIWTRTSPAQALDTPEEADVFRVLGLSWVEPRERR